MPYNSSQNLIGRAPDFLKREIDLSLILVYHEFVQITLAHNALSTDTKNASAEFSGKTPL